MQRLHHAAKFQNAFGTIVCVSGVAAFGCIEMQGVITPVEAVIGAGGCCSARIALTIFFGHGGQVKNRQEMQIGHARFGQFFQVLHALRVGLREGYIFAPHVGGDRCITDREIAHMQFINHHVGGMLHRLGGRVLVPTGRFELG